jgi:tryptophanyl-tRNA synthetase
MSQVTSTDETSTNKSSETFEVAKARSDTVWKQLAEDATRYRMLTGDRPTGPLHIGHYFGSLKNRVLLQNMGVDSYIVIADYQVLTDRDQAKAIQTHVQEVILDYLAVGLDARLPNTTIFCHSHIPELNQLLLPFSTLVTVPELQKNPTIKEEAQAMNLSSVSASMLTYPIHQAADILFCKGQLVPVGKDQLPHLELCRKIARRFNQRYAKKKSLFPEPTALLAETPLIMGLDGDQKMSKSRGNAINLKMTAKETSKLIKRAKTDSERLITYDPDHRPEIANLLRLLSLVSDQSPQEWASEIGMGGGGILKSALSDYLNIFLAPMRERRDEFMSQPQLVNEILEKGHSKARSVAIDTLAEVREAMRMNYHFS